MGEPIRQFARRASLRPENAFVVPCARAVATPALFSCESSIVDPVEIPTIDRTAIFDDVQIRLIRLNTSWMPRKGSIPALDVRLVTFEVEILNHSLETHSIEPSEGSAVLQAQLHQGIAISAQGARAA